MSTMGALGCSPFKTLGSLLRHRKAESVNVRRLMPIRGTNIAHSQRDATIRPAPGASFVHALVRFILHHPFSLFVSLCAVAGLVGLFSVLRTGFREIVMHRFRLLPILFLTIALAACGGDEDQGSGAPEKVIGAFNSAPVEFQYDLDSIDSPLSRRYHTGNYRG